MKLIRAIVREERLPFVRKALESRGVYGMTVTHVQGRGEQAGVHLQFRCGILNIDLLPKIAIEIVVKDDQADMVIDDVCTAAHLGKQGDGRVFQFLRAAQVLRMLFEPGAPVLSPGSPCFFIFSDSPPIFIQQISIYTMEGNFHPPERGCPSQKTGDFNEHR
ncbi:MAG: P-II family nitrogen regulator [Methanomicrobiales archaeon]|nr:P-II family nitrogen regulator [Methanomicrobiales archaeon]